jgi:hypothetical protein
LTIRLTAPGKFLQTVYRGNGDRVVFSSFMYMTETSALVNEASRLRLYAEWSRYWDVSKPVLLEKSPQHVPIVRFERQSSWSRLGQLLIMHRFLQAMFTPSRSLFLVVLRHPLAMLRKNHIRHNCGEKRLKDWLEEKEMLFEEDIQHLHHVAVVHYEHLANNNTLGQSSSWLIIMLIKDGRHPECALRPLLTGANRSRRYGHHRYIKHTRSSASSVSRQSQQGQA